MSIFTRKEFISSFLGGIVVLPTIIHGQQNPNQRPEKGPPLDKELVKEFVGVAHRDFTKVKSMYEANPDLINSVHNLGGWDWEDAIGAAGHVGQREMALFLLEKGARPTICVAAMLGNLDLIRSFVQAYPAMKDAVGPHKISLVKHAKAGGEHALPVLNYLQSIGAKE